MLRLSELIDVNEYNQYIANIISEYDYPSDMVAYETYISIRYVGEIFDLHATTFYDKNIYGLDVL